MQRFNVRPIPAPTPPPLPPPSKSAYAAMHAGPAAPSLITHVIEEKKKGRPSKDEMRKAKMAAASTEIAALLGGKHNRSKVRTYFENRITVLEEEKR